MTKVLHKIGYKKETLWLKSENFTYFSCDLVTFVAKSDLTVERSYNCLCSYLVGPLGPLRLTTSLQGPIAIVDLISVYNNDRLDTQGWQVFVNIRFYFSHSTGFIWPQVMDTNTTRVQTVAGEPTDKFSVQKTLLILYILYYLLDSWIVNTNS